MLGDAAQGDRESIGVTPERQDRPERGEPERPNGTPTDPASKTERKDQVLTQPTASIVASISDAVVAKDGEPFFLCPPDGQVPCARGHGYGLYHHDCRFLEGYELRLGGSAPSPLAASEAEGTRIVLELTNPDLRDLDGRWIRKEELGITWSRRVNGSMPGLEDEIEFRNYRPEPLALPLELTFAASFEDVFQIRGLLAEPTGQLEDPSWDDGGLRFGYQGGDGIDRSLRLTFDPRPEASHGARARLVLRLGPRGRSTVRIIARIEERARPGAAPIERRESPAGASQRASSKRLSSRERRWLGGGPSWTEVNTSSLALEAALDRSFGDLQMLGATLDGYPYYEAGIPWFATLFGRDALISALQTLAFDATMAAGTLRLLARRRGRELDEWRDEAPGKILHELRIGELARMGEIPHSPYFGSVDATPLFLILLAEHAAWTGRLDVFDELRDAVEAALEWLDEYADGDGDGFVDYESRTTRGLANQGWKDSGDAIVTAGGEIAAPPIALVEVQAYAYRAWVGTATLLERAGDSAGAERLREKAQRIQTQFEARYWSDEMGTYALALAQGEPLEVVASNAGHALWAGIAREDRAVEVGRRLLAPDMFNGWGIRTLSADAAAYRPLGYHLGTVWPHDNSLIAAGLRRYGLDDEAEQLFFSLVEAAQQFPHARLPECFAGYARDDYQVPVRYPVACHPQAWAAGTIPSLLVSNLGLTPEALDRRLRVVRPRLPAFAETVELRNLAVGDARAHLRFERHDGATRFEVLSIDGDLEVVAEDPDGSPRGDGQR